MSTFTETINEFVAAKAKLAEYAKTEKGGPLPEFFKPLFDLGISGVTWRQYVPGFNDGDPCEFTMQGLCFLPLSAGPRVKDEYGYTTDDERDDDEYEPDSWSIEYNLKKREVEDLIKYGVTTENVDAVAEAYFALNGALNQAEDYCRIAFGDGAEVTVYPNTVEVEEYWCGY